MSRPWPGRSGPLDQRVFLELANLAASPGRPGEAGVLLSVSRCELAERLHTSRTAADRTLQRLVTAGFLDPRIEERTRSSGEFDAQVG